MRRRGSQRAQADAFDEFVRSVEPRLRQALIATYGLVDGCEATVDALSWAWEHWNQMAAIDHPAAYLYRVGQSATRRFMSRPLPSALIADAEAALPELVPELLPALARLPVQQRTVVVLVHAYGWRQSEVAEILDVSPSTVHEHLGRALTSLRRQLEVHDVR